MRERVRKCEAGSEEPPEPARETWWAASSPRTQSIHVTDLTVLAMSGWRTAQRDSVGRRAVGAASWPQRSCAAFLLPRSVLFQTGADDSHIGLPYKKTKSILVCSAQMAPGNAQSGVAARVVMGTFSPRPPAASDSQVRRGTNTGDLRSSTSWFRGFYVRRIITSFAGSERKKNQRPSATRQMARETWRGTVQWRGTVK